MGSSAVWLEKNIGETNPHMTSVPSYVFIYFFLYQLRAFYNAGFSSVVAISGHGGAHPQDLKLAADVFMKHVPMHVWTGTDFELAPDYPGDHAGKYELSFMMYIRPDRVDFALRGMEEQDGSGGIFALAESAMDASAEYGRRIAEHCIRKLSEIVTNQTIEADDPTSRRPLSYVEMERIMVRCEIAQGAMGYAS